MKSGTGSTDKERRQKKINYNKTFDTRDVAEKRGGKTWLRAGIIYVVHI
jgi:hypothetical protein